MTTLDLALSPPAQGSHSLSLSLSLAPAASSILMSQLSSAEQPGAPVAAARAAVPASAPASAPQDEVNHTNLILVALTAGLCLALLSVGIWNALLVVAVSILLVCNPWVRTLLELPSTDGKRGLSTFDPARYLLSYTDSSTQQGVQDQDDFTIAAAEDDSTMQNDQLYALTVMPDALRDSSQTMIRFVVRDFVQGWYDNLTFAHPNFPISAEANISHTAVSIYLRSRQLKSANTAAEMLLTVQSVLLSSLRRRRASTQYASGAAAAASSARSTWPSTAARVDALRKAVRKLLSRNLAHAERSSPVLMLLLTEIVAKQAWQVVQTIGDPDFINQKIVEWAEPASETSLEAQTISPDELEHLKSLDTAALDTQATEALHSGSAVDEQSSAAPSQLSNESLANSSPSASRSQAYQAPRPYAPPAFAEHSGTNSQSSGADSRTAPNLASRSTGPSQQPRLRVTPPRKANSTGPLSALGGFATGAFGALADAAERAVDVVGGTVDEFGNLLMVPAEPSTRNQHSSSPSNSVDASPRRRYALLAERDDNEPSPSRGHHSRNGDRGHFSDNAAPAYHLDVPPGVDEPPLPESLRQSMRQPPTTYSAAIAGKCKCALKR